MSPRKSIIGVTLTVGALLAAFFTVGAQASSGPTTVTVYRWPSDAVLNAEQVGQTVPLIPLRTIRSSSLSASQQQRIEQGWTLNVPGNASGDESMQPDYCKTSVKHKLGAHLTIIAGTYSTLAHVTMSVTYTGGSTTSLEKGESASGKFGTFTDDKTNTQTSSSGEDFAPHTGVNGWNYKTNFLFREYETICSTFIGGSKKFYVRSTGWAGGAKSVSTTPWLNDEDCVIQEGDSTYHHDKSKADTFDLGGTISDYVGFDYSSQTGYSKDVALAYHFAKHHGGYVCGTNGYPGQAPGLVVSQATSTPETGGNPPPCYQGDVPCRPAKGS